MWLNRSFRIPTWAANQSRRSPRVSRISKSGWRFVWPFWLFMWPLWQAQLELSIGLTKIGQLCGEVHPARNLSAPNGQKASILVDMSEVRPYGVFADWLASQVGKKPLRAVARDVGVSHQTLSKWLQGKTRPEGELLDKVSSHFGEPVESLEEMLGRKRGGVRPEAISFEDAFRMLDLKRPWFLPLSGVASAGPGSPSEGVWRDASERGRRLELVEITGECLEPEISPGDRVTVDIDGRWEYGTVVIARHNGLIVAKRYYGDELRGFRCPPIPSSEAEIIGVAIDVTKKLKPKVI